MILAVFLFIWTGMNVYVFWRASSVPAISRRIPAKLFWSAAFTLWASYIAARILGHLRFNAVAGFLEIIGANWIGILFLLLFSLLAVDVITLFGLVLSRQVLFLRGWALIAAGILSVIALVQGFRAPIVESYEVQLTGLPPSSDGTVIIFASDFHLGTVLGSKWLSARINQIEAQRPDIILLGGDLIEGDHDSELALLPQFRRLSAPLGVWAVTGNHEYYGDSAVGRAELLRDAGVHILHDESTQVLPGLRVAGVDDLTSRRRHGETANFIKKSLLGGEPRSATVLLSHTPWDVEVAAGEGVGLMLAAHTHNGQIWPFNYIVHASHPFISGKYNVNGMTLIVCRGTGTWGPRMRLWSRGEIVRITLRVRHHT